MFDAVQSDEVGVSQRHAILQVVERQNDDSKPLLNGFKGLQADSTAYELHVYEQCKHTNQSAVAEQEGLHFETVKGIFNRWAQRAEKQRRSALVRCLGMD